MEGNATCVYIDLDMWVLKGQGSIIGAKGQVSNSHLESAELKLCDIDSHKWTKGIVEWISTVCVSS